MTITLSERLFTLLEDKLPNLNKRVEKAIEKEVRLKTRSEVGVSVSAPALDTATVTCAPATEPATETAPTEPATETTPTEPAQEPTKEPAPAPKAAKRDAGVEIRAIMHRTRQRFEGEDYEVNTDSEPYKKYHCALNSQFKGIAAILGADKPSKLPEDKVDAFGQMCDELTLDEKGNIVTGQAPF